MFLQSESEEEETVRKLSKRSAVYWTLEPAATKTDEFSSGGFEETTSS